MYGYSLRRRLGRLICQQPLTTYIVGTSSLFEAPRKYTCLALSSLRVTQTVLLALQQVELGPPPAAGLDAYLRVRERRVAEENLFPFFLCISV